MSRIITISREFGSGGREVGKRLSDKLGILYYDEEIIKAISDEMGVSEDYVYNFSEKAFVRISISIWKNFFNKFFYSK